MCPEIESSPHFRGLGQNAILAQIRVGVWFITVDLKDAYFHMQVVQRHRRLLRFTFGERHTNIGFSLFVWLWFHGCSQSVLCIWPHWGSRASMCSTTWTTGSSCPNPRELECCHTDILHHHHLLSPGLRWNTKKSVTLLLRGPFSWGPARFCVDAVLFGSHLSFPCQIMFDLFQPRPPHFGEHMSQNGSMAAASPELPLGLLYKRLFL